MENLKILENELSEKIKIFNKKDVVIVCNDILEAKFYMNNINIEYSYKTGLLHINEERTNNEINLNIALAYLIDLADDILYIRIDNSLDIEIKIK